MPGSELMGVSHWFPELWYKNLSWTFWHLKTRQTSHRETLGTKYQMTELSNPSRTETPYYTTTVKTPQISSA